MLTQPHFISDSNLPWPSIIFLYNINEKTYILKMTFRRKAAERQSPPFADIFFPLSDLRIF